MHTAVWAKQTLQLMASDYIRKMLKQNYNVAGTLSFFIDAGSCPNTTGLECWISW